MRRAHARGGRPATRNPTTVDLQAGRRSGLVTRSIGAGAGCGIIFLSTEDTCGDTGSPLPRARIAGEHQPFPGRLDRWQRVHR